MSGHHGLLMEAILSSLSHTNYLFSSLTCLHLREIVASKSSLPYPNSHYLSFLVQALSCRSIQYRFGQKQGFNVMEGLLHRLNQIFENRTLYFHLKVLRQPESPIFPLVFSMNFHFSDDLIIFIFVFQISQNYRPSLYFLY